MNRSVVNDYGGWLAELTAKVVDAGYGHTAVDTSLGNIGIEVLAVVAQKAQHVELWTSAAGDFNSLTCGLPPIGYTRY